VDFLSCSDSSTLLQGSLPGLGCSAREIFDLSSVFSVSTDRNHSCRIFFVAEGANHLQLPQLARQTRVQTFLLNFSLLPVVDSISIACGLLQVKLGFILELPDRKARGFVV
jgi:hypothetical protein